MKFTKILAAVLAVMMLTFCFAACTPADTTIDENQGEVETEVEANDNDAEAAEGEENKADAENAEGEEANAETETEDNVLVMATNAFFKPYEYYEGEKIVGIDAEIAALIAEKLGMELRIDDMEFSTIITAVDEGSADFGMAGMTVTEERKESVDFTSSYANGTQVIIVKEGSAITSYDDLAAEGATYKIGVQLGTTGDIYASDEFGDRVTAFSTANEAVLALVGGDIDCVIIDNEPAKALVAENEGLAILETTYADEDYAIAVKKGNKELLDKLNAAIDELTAEGKIDEVIAKYIK